MKNLTRNELLILDCLSEDHGTTRNDLVKKSGVKQGSVSYVIASLRKRKMANNVGERRYLMPKKVHLQESTPTRKYTYKKVQEETKGGDHYERIIFGLCMNANSYRPTYSK